MPKFPIAPADLVAVVREVAAENPDHVYRDEFCIYFTPYGAPACGIGHAFARLGITIDELLEAYREEADDSHGNTASISALRRAELIAGEWNDPNNRWLKRFQELQDIQVPWGEAVTHADEAIRKIEDNHA